MGMSGADDVAAAVAELGAVLEPVLEAVQGYKQKAVAAGFSAATAEQMAVHYHRHLFAVLSANFVPLGDVELPDPDKRFCIGCAGPSGRHLVCAVCLGRDVEPWPWPPGKTRHGRERRSPLDEVAMAPPQRRSR